MLSRTLLAGVLLASGGAVPPAPADPPSPEPSLGIVSGAFGLQKDAAVPRPDRVVLRPILPLIPYAGPPAPTEPAECPVAPDGAWSCELPPATYDLAVGAPGFVSQLRQGVEVRAGETLALGVLEIEPGAALSGLLTVEAGTIETGRCLLRVLPSPENRDRQPVYAGDPRLLRRTVGRDGRFTIEPLSPGARALEVSCPGFVTLHVDDVTIGPARENRLRKPLLLRRPLEVAVEVQPPLDPEGLPWAIFLDRQSLGPAFKDKEHPIGRHAGFADRYGRFVIPKIAPGLARLQVLDGRGVRKVLREVRLDSAADSPIRVDLRTIQVVGRLTYRGQSMTGILAFDDGLGGKAVVMRTGRRGEFEGELPRAGLWTVGVTAPRLRRAPIPVRVKVEPDESGEARVEIRIPDSKVAGRVLDEGGQPADQVTVALFGVDDDRSTTTDERGRFDFRFVTPGPAALAARRAPSVNGPGGISPPVEIQVSEGKDLRGQVLDLVAMRKVAGLVSAGDRSLVRVEIGALAESAFPQRTFSGGGGTFQLNLPDDLVAEVLLVRPLGGVLRALPIRLREGAVRLDLDDPDEGILTADRGTVAIDLPESWGALREGGQRLDLFVDGHFIPLGGLERWTQERNHLLSSAALDLAFPRLAPGTYRACMGPAGPFNRIDPAAYRAGKVTCDEGRLDAGEELRLKPVL